MNLLRFLTLNINGRALHGNETERKMFHCNIFIAPSAAWLKTALQIFP
jgi:hypothetical protein